MDTSIATLDAWLERYGAAWAARDGAAAAALFTEDGRYDWGPFEAPLVGRAAIADRWQAATADLLGIEFTTQELGRDGDRRFVRWQAELEDAEGTVLLDGVFVLDFAADGRCKHLQEWWLVRP